MTEDFEFTVDEATGASIRGDFSGWCPGAREIAEKATTAPEVIGALALELAARMQTIDGLKGQLEWARRGLSQNGGPGGGSVISGGGGVGGVVSPGGAGGGVGGGRGGGTY